ncbi:MAG TPA: N-6 DNA methylase [Candidatus Bathyarchaeia archaeon]|nr:N-6 DNA methylase [Candidatus Bathyarchaeia archaeon]
MSEESEELRELVRRTRVNKYSQSDPVGLLMRMIEEIRMRTHHHNYRCWEMMVEYIAKWLVLNKKTGLASHGPLRGFQGLDLKKDPIYEHLERQDLFQHYYVAGKASPWDHIGEVWCEKLELVREGQNPTPRAIVEMMTTMTYGNWNPEAELLCWESYRQYVIDYWLEYHSPPRHIEPLRFPLKTQLDPCTGTGRFLIVASQMMPKAPLVMFGIEVNISLYQACLVNMALFSNHPYSIICADTLSLDYEETGPGSQIWDLGNRWDPPDMTPFYWKEPPITAHKFSLKAFTELPKEKLEPVAPVMTTPIKKSDQ